MCPIVEPNYEESPPLNPGTYRCKIISCEQKVSKSSGNNYLNWKLDTGGSWVYLMTGLSGKGAQKLKELIRAAKYPSYESGAIDTNDLLGCFVMAKLEKQYNQDGTESKYLSVTEIHPDSGPAFNEDDVGF